MVVVGVGRGGSPANVSLFPFFLAAAVQRVLTERFVFSMVTVPLQRPVPPG